MEIVNYILDGLVEALELERELGVKTVEFDRSLLAAPATSHFAPPASQSPIPPASHFAPPASHSPASQSPASYPYVFLHDRPLSEEGNAMMTKIIVALGATTATAPVIVEMPVPKAKAYVIMGRAALEKFQPTLKGAPGQWLTTPKGSRVLITYSPDYILRFKEITPAVRKIKEDMWRALKVLKHVE